MANESVRLDRVEKDVESIKGEVKELSAVVNGGYGNIGLDERARKVEHELKDVKSASETSPKVYVTKEEFHPVRVVIYGTIGSVMLAFLGGLVAIVLKGQ